MVLPPLLPTFLLLNDAVCLRLSSAYVLVTLALAQILDLDEKREREELVDRNSQSLTRVSAC